MKIGNKLNLSSVYKVLYILVGFNVWIELGKLLGFMEFKNLVSIKRNFLSFIFIY